MALSASALAALSTGASLTASMDLVPPQPARTTSVNAPTPASPPRIRFRLFTDPPIAIAMSPQRSRRSARAYGPDPGGRQYVRPGVDHPFRGKSHRRPAPPSEGDPRASTRSTPHKRPNDTAQTGIGRRSGTLRPRPRATRARKGQDEVEG